MNVINYICLFCWIFMAVLGIISAAKGYKISYVSYICATIICIVYYIERIWMR